MLLRVSFYLVVTYFVQCYSDLVSTPSKIYFASKEVMNWTNARNACLTAGGVLVSILTQEDKTNIEEFLEENHIKPQDAYAGYWLAGIRSTNGTFYWDRTKNRLDGTLDSWLYGEPNNGNNNENCIELKNDMVKLGWNDLACTDLRRYLCQSSRIEIIS